MRAAPLENKVRILTDSWPIVVVTESGALNAEERRHAMVALSAAVLSRGGPYGLVLDLDCAELLSNDDRAVIAAFGRAAGHSCRAVSVVTQAAAGCVTGYLWARELQQSPVLVSSVADGILACGRALGMASPALRNLGRLEA